MRHLSVTTGYIRRTTETNTMDIGSFFALYVCTFVFLLTTYYFVGYEALKQSGGPKPRENQIILTLTWIATVLDVIAAIFIVSEDLSNGDAYLVFGTCMSTRVVFGLPDRCFGFRYRVLRVASVVCTNR